jgi:hypothetical protein
MYLNLDLQLSICSYFDLDEVLYLFEDNHKLRDLILKRYKYYYPTWQQVIVLNNYIIAKYFLDKKFLPDKSTLKQTIDKGDLKMLQLFDYNNIKFEIEELNDSAFNGNYDVFMFLISIGINPISKTLESAQSAYDMLSDIKTIDYFYKISTDGYQKIILYLKENLKNLDFV